MKITWHGHSCFCVESAGYRIVLDPYPKSIRGYGQLSLRANEVLCSHEHFDHNCRKAVTLEEGVPSPFTVETVAALHDDQGGALRGQNTIHVLRAEGMAVAHLGDLGHLPTAEQTEKLRGCDVLLIPVGGTYTIDAPTARRVVELLRPRITVPMHYRRGSIGFENIGTLDEFLALVPAESIRVLEGNSFDPAAVPAGVTVPLYQP